VHKKKIISDSLFFSVHENGHKKMPRLSSGAIFLCFDFSND